MTSRSASTQIVVIHRWQVIVDQRIRMNHFERAGRTQQIFDWTAEHFAGGQQEDGAKPLATGKDAPANSLMNGERLHRFRWQKATERAVDQGATFGKETFKVEGNR